MTSPFTIPCQFGSHRVLEPKNVLPQAAWRLDARPFCAANEVLLDVVELHVDAASFAQLYAEQNGEEQRIAERIKAIVAQRGKLDNPVTGSGGVLRGRVREIGPALRGHPLHGSLRVGEEIVTLVSLTLTPLQLDHIRAVHAGSAHVEVQGKAVLFESGFWARVPSDLPEAVALAALDVCGAPALAIQLIQPGDSVLILGGGRSGLLVLAAALEAGAGRIVVVETNATAKQRIANVADCQVIIADACVAHSLWRELQEHTFTADVTFSCVDVPGVEMGAILNTAPHGTVCFFSMATNFSAATLGAEGIGSSVRLLMGNGYTPGHADLALDLLRHNRKLYEAFADCCGMSR